MGLERRKEISVEGVQPVLPLQELPVNSDGNEEEEGEGQGDAA
jgi:hypothetical protein